MTPRARSAARVMGVTTIVLGAGVIADTWQPIMHFGDAAQAVCGCILIVIGWGCLRAARVTHVPLWFARLARGFELAVLIGVVIVAVRGFQISSRHDHHRGPTVHEIEMDMRNLVVAEESYFRGRASYTTSLSALRFVPSASVSVSITSAGATGWTATAEQAFTATTCAVYVGSGTAAFLGQMEGVPKCPRAWETDSAIRETYPSYMKDDLRNLRRAEASWLAGHGSYAMSLAAMNFTVSTGVHIAMRSASRSGWAATASHTGTTDWCGIYVGSARAPIAGQGPGELQCVNRGRTYPGHLKSDLRELMAAQASWLASHGSFGTSLAAMNFTASAGVRVAMRSVSRTGWAATASYSGTTDRCGIYVGSAPAPIAGQRPGELKCVDVAGKEIRAL